MLLERVQAVVDVLVIDATRADIDQTGVHGFSAGGGGREARERRLPL
ncbi:MAG: hypothetical protein JWP44_4448 [Mucilaginibacter sp.]|nr:hypothetical protein [Mucilaginibacter sp.]